MGIINRNIIFRYEYNAKNYYFVRENEDIF